MTTKAKKNIILLFIGLLLLVGAFFLAGLFKPDEPGEEIIERQKVDIEKILADRYERQMAESGEVDLFGDDDIARILVIGLDSRVGETAGHCDAIQMLEIDRKRKSVQITAVPRGTYVPLTNRNLAATEYYVSNSCAIEGLEYGINQIEKILGKKADHLVMVGFSEAMGIIRHLKLPGPETLRWLRLRQGYAIGEPQRARNHSTFIKQMMLRFLPKKDSKLDASWQYVIYRMIKTDLSFEEVRSLISVLIDMELEENQQKIGLAMRPSYEVADIPYDEKNLELYLSSMLNPIKGYLSKDDYSERSKEDIESDILKKIDEKKEDCESLKWFCDNRIWLQFDDEYRRLGLQCDLTSRYARCLGNEEGLEFLEDYILEMEYMGLPEWSDKGKKVLEEMISGEVEVVEQKQS